MKSFFVAKGKLFNYLMKLNLSMDKVRPPERIDKFELRPYFGKKGTKLRFKIYAHVTKKK